MDAHKTLNAPYDCGIVLCRHPQATLAAMQNTGAYIVYSEQRDGMLYTPEVSRRSRGAELWATLKTLGRAGTAELVEGLCDRARQAAAQLRAAGFRGGLVRRQLLAGPAGHPHERVLLGHHPGRHRPGRGRVHPGPGLKRDSLFPAGG